MRTNLSGRIAAVLVGLEGLGLAALTVREVVAIASGDTGSIESAIALAVLTLVGAAAVIAFAFAIWRGQPWGRSGGGAGARRPGRGRAGAPGARRPRRRAGSAPAAR